MTPATTPPPAAAADAALTRTLPHQQQPSELPETPPALSARGLRRRTAIVTAASRLFASRGYAAVGIDDIGQAAGVTGPAIYRHFDSKAAVLAAVIADIIDVVADPPQLAAISPQQQLRRRIRHYASGVAQRRELMTVFVHEVHHLPDPHAHILRRRQRDLVMAWRENLAAIHPQWPSEAVRTAVHATFGLLNAVATFNSPLSDEQLAAELTALAIRACDLGS